MAEINNLIKFNENAPGDVVNFVSDCKNEEELMSKLKEDSSFLVRIIENIDFSNENEVNPLAGKLLYMIEDDVLKDPGVMDKVKGIELMLRNCNVLNFQEANELSNNEDVHIKHRVVLACEQGVSEIVEGDWQSGKLLDINTDIAPEDVWDQVIEYLYKSDEGRKEFFSKEMDMGNLPQISMIANYWNLGHLIDRCDEEYSHSIGDLVKDNSLDDLIHFARGAKLTKFEMLVNFIQNRVNEGKDIDAVVKIVMNMEDPEKIWDFVALCSDEEIKAFATLKSELGKACSIPSGTLDREGWEMYFKAEVLDKDILPMPPEKIRLYAIAKKAGLEPRIMYKPQKVKYNGVERDFNEGLVAEMMTDNTSGLKTLEVGLNFSSVAKAILLEKNGLAHNAELRDIPADEPYWFVTTKIDPKSLDKSYSHQKELCEKNGFKVSKIMQYLLYRCVSFRVDQRMADVDLYSRCEEGGHDEVVGNYQTIVGGFGPSHLRVYYSLFVDYLVGVSVSG